MLENMGRNTADEAGTSYSVEIVNHNGESSRLTVGSNIDQNIKDTKCDAQLLKENGYSEDLDYDCEIPVIHETDVEVLLNDVNVWKEKYFAVRDKYSKLKQKYEKVIDINLQLQSKVLLNLCDCSCRKNLKCSCITSENHNTKNTVESSSSENENIFCPVTQSVLAPFILTAPLKSTVPSLVTRAISSSPIITSTCSLKPVTTSSAQVLPSPVSTLTPTIASSSFLTFPVMTPAKERKLSDDAPVTTDSVTLMDTECDEMLDKKLEAKVEALRAKPGEVGDSMFTKSLAIMIFGTETLANSSVTGQPCRAKKDSPAKPPLPNEKLSLLTKLFIKRMRRENPGVTDKEMCRRTKKIRAYIAEKIATLNRTNKS